jgi:hypothetical protein
MRPVVTALLAALTLAAANAGATVLYKLTDRAGNVTYADSIPRGFDGAVLRLDIEPAANSIPTDRIPEILSAPPSPAPSIALSRAQTDDDRLRQARARVDAARLTLDDARNNSLAEDWIYLGQNNPLGMRRMPRPEYSARLERLEGDVLVAEEDLRALEREIRYR